MKAGRRFAAYSVMLAVAILTGGGGDLPYAKAEMDGSVLQNIDELQRLKDAFNADTGKPRLLLLFSPT